jgi:cytochrome c-type biogenesis protein
MVYEILIPFFAGLASFLSPCIFPIVPGFISTLAGTVRREGNGSRVSTPTASKDGLHQTSLDTAILIKKEINITRRTLFLSTVHFVLGFCLTFALISVLIACFCTPGSLVGLVIKHTIAWIGGFVVLAFGVFLILSMKIPRLNFQRSIPLSRLKSHRRLDIAYMTSFVFGITFAAGWTPCVGPLLGSILALAVDHPATAYNQLMAYALGVTMPFLIVSTFLADAQRLFKPLVKYTKYFDLTMGVILIIIGIVFLVDQIVPLY